MRLCFGTFVMVLKHCRQFNVTDRMLVGEIVGTVDADNQYKKQSNASQVSRMLNCTTNFSLGTKDEGSRADQKADEPLSSIRQIFYTVNKKDVVMKLQSNVLPLIDEDKKKLVVLALLDIIKNDTVIDTEKGATFEKYVGTNKPALLKQREFVLPDFLAGLLLYTIEVNNRSGRDCVQKITPEYIQGFNKKCETILLCDTLVQTLQANIEENTLQVDANKTDSTFQNMTPPEQMIEIFQDAIVKYHIAKFISTNPEIALEVDLPEAVDAFVYEIQSMVLENFISFQKEIAYQNIAKFKALIDNYNGNLACNMDLHGHVFIPSHKANDKWLLEFNEFTMDYRKQINTLYQIISDGGTLFIY